METEIDPGTASAPTLLQKTMRSCAILCGATGGIAGVLSIATSIRPSWFYHSGDEHMAWAIGLTIVGSLATLIGWVAASLAGRKKWVWFLLNSVFAVAWIAAEMLRVLIANG